MNPKIRKVCLLVFSSWYLNPSWASALQCCSWMHTPVPTSPHQHSAFPWPFFGFGGTFLQRRSGVVEFASPDPLRLRDVAGELSWDKVLGGLLFCRYFSGRLLNEAICFLPGL